MFGDVTLTPHAEEVHQLTSERRLVVRDPSPVPEPRPDANLGREQATVARDEAAAPVEEAKPLREEPSAGREEPRPFFEAPLAIVSLPPDDLHEDPEPPQATETPEAVRPVSPSSPWGFFLAFALLAGAVVGVLRMAGRDVETPRTQARGGGHRERCRDGTRPDPAPRRAAATPRQPPTTNFRPDRAIPLGYGLLRDHRAR